MVVDRQMHILPADPAGLALACAVMGDAVADAIELGPSFLMSMWMISPGAARS
jgi:hypothetical protein